MTTIVNLQSLVDAATRRSGNNLVRLDPLDTLVISKPVEVQNAFRLEVQGNGISTIIQPEGKMDQIFLFENSSHTIVQGLYGLVSGLDRVDSIFHYLATKTRSGIIPSNNHHRDIRIEGNKNVGAGILFNYLPEGDINNEDGRSSNVQLYHMDYGWMILGQQAKNHSMVNCRFGHGISAVYSTGSFHWQNGGGSGCSDAFFRIMDQTDNILIQHAEVEASRRYIHTSGVVVNNSGFTTSSQGIEIIGGRFMTDQMDQDDNAMLFEHPGPVGITGFQLGSGKQRAGWIKVVPSEGIVECRRMSFGSWESLAVSDANPAYPFRAPPGAFTSLGQSHYHDSKGKTIRR